MVNTILLIFMVCVGIFLIFLLIKNNITFNNRELMREAIYLYLTDESVDTESTMWIYFDDMESYEETLYRLWDFGYKHILPKEKYEIIKPYIELAKEK